MVKYVIRLRREEGTGSYLFWLQDPFADGPNVCQDFAGAAVFDDEELAEEMLQKLERTYGLNRDEADIEARMIPDNVRLKLGGPDHDDGISVIEEDGKRYILVSSMGAEAGEEVPGELADLLVRILWKIEQRLRRPLP